MSDAKILTLKSTAMTMRCSDLGGGVKNQAQVKSPNLVNTSRKNQLRLRLVSRPRYQSTLTTCNM